MIVFCSLWTNAQTLSFNFPYFSGQDYTFCLIQGQKNDTISVGKIPVDGHLTIVLPKQYKNYRGMGKWFLKKGGGLALVINQENFSVESLDSIPSLSNIRFTHSIENSFLNQNYLEQQEILSKYTTITTALNLYKTDDSFFSSLKDEQERLKESYKKHSEELNLTQLYASEFSGIANAVAGLTDQLYDSDEEQSLSLVKYITNEMSWESLYTSGHWNSIISIWLQLQLKQEDESMLIENIHRIVLKIRNNGNLYFDFINELYFQLEKFNKEDLLQDLNSFKKQ